MAAVQVILDAIAKSDGTRKGVTDAVFSGDGHHDPGRQVRSIGKEIKIDPATGDTTAMDITVEIDQGQQGDLRQGPAVS